MLHSEGHDVIVHARVGNLATLDLKDVALSPEDLTD